MSEISARSLKIKGWESAFLERRHFFYPTAEPPFSNLDRLTSVHKSSLNDIRCYRKQRIFSFKYTVPECTSGVRLTEGKTIRPQKCRQPICDSDFLFPAGDLWLRRRLGPKSGGVREMNPVKTVYNIGLI